MGKADLHIHSSASDGDLSPKKLLEKVKEKKLSVVSITDHDTIDGYREVKELAPELGIELVPGVEITAVWKRREVHLLAYHFNEHHSRFRFLLGKQKRARRLRMKAIVASLNRQGLDIEYDEILAISGNGNVGRPHAAAVLIKKGYVASVSEAFIRYLSAENIEKIETAYAGMEEVVEAIKEAGGVLSLAHPGPLYTETEVEELLDFGLDGLECIHPSHSYTVQKKFSDMARAKNLLITGGSDFHGTGKSQYDPFFGIVTLGLHHAESLKRSSINRKNTIKA